METVALVALVAQGDLVAKGALVMMFSGELVMVEMVVTVGQVVRVDMAVVALAVPLVEYIFLRVLSFPGYLSFHGKLVLKIRSV